MAYATPSSLRICADSTSGIGGSIGAVPDGRPLSSKQREATQGGLIQAASTTREVVDRQENAGTSR
jgi:hypothetical protein